MICKCNLLIEMSVHQYMSTYHSDLYRNKFDLSVQETLRWQDSNRNKFDSTGHAALDDIDKMEKSGLSPLFKEFIQQQLLLPRKKLVRDIVSKIWQFPHFEYPTWNNCKMIVSSEIQTMFTHIKPKFCLREGKIQCFASACASS
jgi:hypothetical protein